MDNRLERCLEVLKEHFPEETIVVEETALVLNVSEGAFVRISLEDGILAADSLNAWEELRDVVSKLMDAGVELDKPASSVRQLDFG